MLQPSFDAVLRGVWPPSYPPSQQWLDSGLSRTSIRRSAKTEASFSLVLGSAAVNGFGGRGLGDDWELRGPGDIQGFRSENLNGTAAKRSPNPPSLTNMIHLPSMESSPANSRYRLNASRERELVQELVLYSILDSLAAIPTTFHPSRQAALTPVSHPSFLHCALLVAFIQPAQANAGIGDKKPSTRRREGQVKRPERPDFKMAE
ncbi:hypothetical protein L218DRAFT_1080962 [Marasmius fiardii PR-910]|nr:hypothetical protein L218DRAFT_1080962 [Marasmius fiardii PR-910]